MLNFLDFFKVFKLNCTHNGYYLPHANLSNVEDVSLPTPPKKFRSNRQRAGCSAAKSYQLTSREATYEAETLYVTDAV